MVERGGVPSLTSEPVDEGWVLRETRPKDLDRYIAVQEFVVREVDDGHPALPKRPKQAVTAGKHTLGQYHVAI
jgi:hypothetical protein